MFSGTRHGSVQCLGVIVENSRQGVLTVDGGVLAIFIAYGNSRLLLTASALMPRHSVRPSTSSISSRPRNTASTEREWHRIHI